MAEQRIPRAEWGERRGPEWDYGVHWKLTDQGPDWPCYRVSWIIETGELYAISARAADDVIVLATIPKDGDYLDLSQFEARQQVEKILQGWAEEPRSLDWIRSRLAAASTREQPRAPDKLDDCIGDAFRLVCEAEAYAFAGGMTDLKNDLIAAHSALLRASHRRPKAARQP